MSEDNITKEQALGIIAKFTVDRKAMFNPFVRSGITARRLAEELGWFLTDNKVDTRRVKALFKELIADGRVVSGGKERTLHNGSAYLEVYHIKE